MSCNFIAGEWRQKLCRQHTDTVGRMTLSGAQDVTAAVEVAERIARQ
jgi:hypothetical protein